MNRNRTHPGEQERMAERQAKALELRKTGMNYEKIGEACGVSPSTAHKDVKRAMEELREYGLHLSVELRQMELLRLDDALNRVYEVIDSTADPEIKLKAVDRMLRLSESRRKLLGLDEPQRMDVTTGGEPMQKRVIIEDPRALPPAGDQTEDDPAEDADPDGIDYFDAG